MKKLIAVLLAGLFTASAFAAETASIPASIPASTPASNPASAHIKKLPRVKPIFKKKPASTPKDSGPHTVVETK